jgi:glycine cleavage system H protein
MNFPNDLRYTKEHEWVRVQNNIATIGITDFAQGELGDIVFVEVNKTNEVITKDTVFGTIEAVKTVSDLFLPVSGVIIEVNALLQSEPELINNDPFGDGWIIKLEIENEEEVNQLMDAEAYRAMVS